VQPQASCHRSIALQRLRAVGSCCLTARSRQEPTLGLRRIIGDKVIRRLLPNDFEFTIVGPQERVIRLTITHTDAPWSMAWPRGSSAGSMKVLYSSGIRGIGFGSAGLLGLSGLAVSISQPVASEHPRCRYVGLRGAALAACRYCRSG
jgi:hypothetical protein